MSSTARRAERKREFEAQLDQEQREREEHEQRYASVAAKLRELEIDPCELRDYLAGLGTRSS